jgi:peptidyl-prolyl cis-trans isomerase B (cyclophilin B)
MIPMKNVFLVLMMSLVFLSCGYTKELEQDNASLKEQISVLKSDMDRTKAASDRLAFLSARMQGLKARIVTNQGNIEVEFFADKAPIHCFNFITRAESGFYNNTEFHRVIPGFMIQGGDPNSKDKDPANDGMGGPVVAIPHEFNEVHHAPGILSMARVGDVTQGAGSQFFIMHGDSPQLDKQYTAFGKVLTGMDVVDKIATTETNKTDPRLRDHPVKPMVIKTIEIYR